MGSISMSQVEKKSSILWVVFEKGVQFCELYSKKNQFLETSVKKKVGFFESYF